MWSPGMGLPLSRPNQGRRLAVWAALAMGWIFPTTGCQVEYAGMTLPSGKYMHDDVQFRPRPGFPRANTQAATQCARMQAMGMEVPPPGPSGPLTVTPAAGGLNPLQDRNGRPTESTPAPSTTRDRSPARPARSRRRRRLDLGPRTPRPSRPPPAPAPAP